MADALLTRIGDNNDSDSDFTNLFLKVYAGEVLTAFQDANIMLDRTMVRSISSGKSAQFPATWKGDAHYHTPGTEIVGQEQDLSERVILIDDLLIADRTIAQIDEAMAHYDVRSIYSQDAGLALARRMDKNLLQVAILAARSAGTITATDGLGASDGGTVITSAAVTSSADAIVAAIFAAAVALDQKNVPMEDRYVAIPPALYYLVVNSGSKSVNQDYTQGNNGGVDSGVVFRIAGMPLVKTNHMPSTNVNTGPSAYQGNFSTDAFVVFHKSAVGTVKLIDLGVEMAWDIRRQSTLILAKIACGHGILRPESAVEIKTS